MSEREHPLVTANREHLRERDRALRRFRENNDSREFRQAREHEESSYAAAYLLNQLYRKGR